MEEKTVSNVMKENFDRVDKKKFNMIVAGCGTGKSFWATHDLFKTMPDLMPNEVIFVTSRSITANQQARYDNMVRYTRPDLSIIQYWNDDWRIDECAAQFGMRVMTYTGFITLIVHCNLPEEEGLQNVKVVIFDECHTIYSDKQINDMGALKVWLIKELPLGRKMIFGMTATDDIFQYYRNNLGYRVNYITDEPLRKLKAQKLICTSMSGVWKLLKTGHLKGKTIILCHSIKLCRKLVSTLPNSQFVVSSSRKDVSDEEKKKMDEIREYIEENETLPDKVAGKPLEILITTSALREGFNLKEESGVRNVISTLADPLNLTQFCGRARYDLDTIVVADGKSRLHNKKGRKDYFAIKEEKFKEFFRDGNDTGWLSEISHLFHDPQIQPIFFREAGDAARFVEEINKRWLVPEGCTDTDKYKIWKEETKQELVQLALDCRILGEQTTRKNVNFCKVVKMLKDSFGYTVEEDRYKRVVVDGKTVRPRYRLIVAFDQDKVSYGMTDE